MKLLADARVLAGDAVLRACNVHSMAIVTLRSCMVNVCTKAGICWYQSSCMIAACSESHCHHLCGFTGAPATM